MFSRSCQYAIQAILYIGLHHTESRRIGLREISSSQEIPIHYLSKILQLLVKNKLLNSSTGPGGGFALLADPNELKLMQVVQIIDGLDIFEVCGIGMKICSDESPCPIHENFKVVKEEIKKLLNEKSLRDLIDDVKKGKSFVTFIQDKAD